MNKLNLKDTELSQLETLVSEYVGLLLMRGPTLQEHLDNLRDLLARLNYSTAQFKLDICMRVLVESLEKYHEILTSCTQQCMHVSCDMLYNM